VSWRARTLDAGARVPSHRQVKATAAAVRACSEHAQRKQEQEEVEAHKKLCAQLQDALQCERAQRAHVEETLGQQVQGLQQQRAQLQQRLEEQECRIQELRRSWRQDVQDVERQGRERLRVHEAASRTAVAASKRAQADLAREREVVRSLRAEIAEVEERRKEALHAKQRFCSEQEKLQADLAREREVVGSLRAEIAEVVGSLRTEIEEVEERHREAVHAKQSFCSEHEKLQARAAELEDQASDLECQIQQQNELLQRLHAAVRIHTLPADLAAAAASRATGLIAAALDHGSCADAGAEERARGEAAAHEEGAHGERRVSGAGAVQHVAGSGGETTGKETSAEATAADQSVLPRKLHEAVTAASSVQHAEATGGTARSPRPDAPEQAKLETLLGDVRSLLQQVMSPSSAIVGGGSLGVGTVGGSAPRQHHLRPAQAVIQLAGGGGVGVQRVGKPHHLRDDASGGRGMSDGDHLLGPRRTWWRSWFACFGE